METIDNIGLEFVTQLSNDLSCGNLDLPAFPDVALRIKNTLEDPDVSAEQLANLVAADPVFTARLLKTANSAFANRTSSVIKDVRIAVTRLGFKMAYNTAVTIAMEQVMNGDSNTKIRPYLEELWQHSVQVAAFSYVIAKKLTRINPDEAMLAGLLHDIGKFYILTRSEAFPELFNEPQVLADLMAVWHTGVGNAILDAWDFSEDIRAAADEHEVLDRSHFGPADLVDVVLVANLFSYIGHPDKNPELDRAKTTALKRLNLTQESALDVIEASREEVQSIMQALGK